PEREPQAEHEHDLGEQRGEQVDRRAGERCDEPDDRGYENERHDAEEAVVVQRPQRWNSSWMRRTAASRSFSATTSEMFSSLEPCAIATTFTPAFPSAPKTRAATPGVPRIPSPTAATMATGRSMEPRSTSCRRRSRPTQPLQPVFTRR